MPGCTAEVWAACSVGMCLTLLCHEHFVGDLSAVHQSSCTGRTGSAATKTDTSVGKAKVDKSDSELAPAHPTNDPNPILCTTSVSESDSETASSNTAGDSSTVTEPGTSNRADVAQLPAKKKRMVANTSYDNYTWIAKVDDGYVCKVCREFGIKGLHDKGHGRGTWVSVPLPLSSSRKLYDKAAKHANSAAHQAAVAASRLVRNPGPLAQLVTAANEAAIRDSDAMKTLFRSAYFMFSSEIAHTTHWRELVSTVADSDSSCQLKKFLTGLPANAHHLSSTTVTSILEAFGDAMEASLRDKVAAINQFSVMADECTDVNGTEKLSICIRYLTNSAVVELFLGCWPLISTKAADVCQSIVANLATFGLTPDRLVSASFDGASNMSGQRGGVQALLKKSAPSLVFVHCRSHLLQLALVKASNLVPEMKQVLSAMNTLYSLFSHSPLRLNILRQTEEALDGMAHKLVQPGPTRWLSFEGSVTVVLKHYSAICISLEAIYVESGTKACEAGGLLLTLRKSSTLQFMLVLRHFLQPLARLSKTLQSSSGNIAAAMAIVKATIAALQDDFDLADIKSQSDDMTEQAISAGVKIEKDSLPENKKAAICEKFHKAVVDNLNSRFSDAVTSLCEVSRLRYARRCQRLTYLSYQFAFIFIFYLNFVTYSGALFQIQTILSTKPEVADFTKVTDILGVSPGELESEWRILRRLEGDLSGQETLIMLATSSEKCAMFPAFSSAIRKLLLLPVGTASVERSFSTMNRILNSDRCRLLPGHSCQLMQMAIEGPRVPDVRDADEGERAKFNVFLDRAYKQWLAKPRRGLNS
jgi:Domain of unknown function (DUF4371)/hAT family C-terminal dimerisation region